MHVGPTVDWPDLLMLVGDQVYADILSPAVQQRVAERRAGQYASGEADPDTAAPADQIADFEEYTWLYRESWEDESLRWLLSTVATAMIFDDHDVHDDWNTSAAWVTSMRRLPWWRDRIVSGYATYWIYQHIGNLSPAALAEDPIWREVRNGGEHTRTVAEYAEGATDDEVDERRWSYRRDFGRTRLLVLDSRAGRQLEEGNRSMLSEREFAWVEEQAAEPGYDDLLLATSLPWLLAPGLHHLEAWNEAVCGGAWGTRPVYRAEQIRQAVDLEHWAAFSTSFHRLTALIADIGSGPEAPRTIAVLSGDVHHAYVAEADFPGRAKPVTSRVIQAVCSPIRNPLDRKERAVLRFLHSKPAAWIGRALSRSAGVERPAVNWHFTQKPTFDNQIGTVVIAPGGVRLEIEKTVAEEWEYPVLHPSITWADMEPRRR
jgi:phosphodiesterase/alkaline phosphatase D-like protein